MSSGPFGVREKLEAWGRSSRASWLVAILVVTLVCITTGFGGGPLVFQLGYRPEPPPVSEWVEAWCADGRVLRPPPTALCKVPHNPIRDQAHFEAFVAAQPLPQWRPLPPHRFTIALITMLLGLGVWWWVRPVSVELDHHRVRIGRRSFARHELRRCQIKSFLGYPRFVITTDQGVWHSPPVQNGWALQELVAQIQSLVPPEREHPTERQARERLRRDAARLAQSARRRTRLYPSH